MARYEIAWLPGDGIGPEVLEGARTVLEAAGFDADYIHGDIGWEFWKKEGDPLPERTNELLRRTDCALFGAITSKPDAEARLEVAPAIRRKGVRYSSAILRIRRLLDLYICLRPCRAYPGNPGNSREGIDITIFRENTEGLYSGVEYEKVPAEFRTVKGMERIPKQAAIAVRSITRKASLRIAQAAFECAAAPSSWSAPLGRSRKGNKYRARKVTAVHKASVLRATDGLFLESVREAAHRFPSVDYEEMNIDACAMELVRDPNRFDVIVTTNLFGDILSDLCAQLTGGMGFAPSGNLGDEYAVFEPVHGSAPDIAKKGIANPAAAILSAKMMLEWLGERELAGNVERAVAAVVREGKVRTPDMGGRHCSREFAGAVAAKSRALS